MEYEFLRRLFALCCEKFYKRIEDADKADRKFDETLKDLDKEKANEIDSANGDSIEAYELQGFINGFRLCWMMQRETAPAWYGQQAPELKEGGRMSGKEASFTAELLKAIMETDTWRTELVDNQSIQEAEKALSAALREIVDISTEDKIMGLAFEYSEAVETAAILYGIRVADALRGGQVLPSAVNVGT